MNIELIENIGLTGLFLFILIFILPKLFGDYDPPFYIKAIIVIPGIIGGMSAIISLILLIWAE